MPAVRPWHQPGLGGLFQQFKVTDVSCGPERTPLVVSLYQQYLVDQDKAQFVRQVSAQYTSATLERIATSSRERLARRAGVVALGMLGSYESNATLGRALTDQDRAVRMLAEDGIRAVWQRAGSSQQRARLQSIVELIEARKYQAAIRQATALVEQAPWFAEVWNQRAMANFCTGRFVESIRDCRQALEINPYHFAAAAGMGQCHVRLGNPVAALECFRRALRLNPNLEGIRAEVVRLQKSLKDR